MAPQKETFMVLKVDLECNRCYTKVKRTLCQFPQIQDQIYNDKQNTVMIKVVCCSPEKIRDKICAKGGKSIKGIEIVQLNKPAADKPAADKPKEAPPADKPKQAPPADKPKQAPPADKPKQAPPADKPKEAPAADKPKEAPAAAAKPAPADGKPAKNVTFKPDEQPKGDAPAAKPKEAAPPAAKPADQAALMAPMMPPAMYGYGYPVNVGCLDCYEGRMCYQHGNGFGYGGYAAPPLPPPGGYGYGGYGVPPPPPPGGYGQSYKPGYCVSRYGDYVSEENATGCVVM